MASKALKQEYPLHWLAWHNEFRELDRVLGLKEVSVTGRGLSLCFLAAVLEVDFGENRDGNILWISLQTRAVNCTFKRETVPLIIAIPPSFPSLVSV